MCSIRRQFIRTLMLVVPFTAPVLAQEESSKDPRIGTQVLVTKAGAELRTPKETVWRAYLGDVFTVTLTNGEWLWIQEKGGWLWEKEVVPFDSAITEIKKRLTTAPTAENYHLHGIALLSHDRYEEAIREFSASLRRQPRNAGALNNRGKAHYLSQNYDAAIEDFSAALKQDPKSFLALNNRALVHIAKEDYTRANRDLQAALLIIPEYPEALNNRGVVNQKLKKYDRAIADFTEAIRLDPRYVDALGNRAYTYRLQGQYDKAVADLEAAITLNPDTYEASNDLAWILATAKDEQIRNGQRALELAKAACAISQYEQWNTLDTLGVAYAANEKFEDAATWLTTALDLAPESEKTRIQGHLELVSAGRPVRE